MLGDLASFLDTPLAELADGEPERVMLAQLARATTEAPSFVTLGNVGAFEGAGRPATQAGMLKSAGALALAEHLGLDTQHPASIASMDDLADPARRVLWTLSSGLLEVAGSRQVAGPRDRCFERGPLPAWLAAAATMLGAGQLLGSARGGTSATRS